MADLPILISAFWRILFVFKVLCFFAVRRPFGRRSVFALFNIISAKIFVCRRCLHDFFFVCTNVTV